MSIIRSRRDGKLYAFWGHLKMKNHSGVLLLASSAQGLYCSKSK